MPVHQSYDISSADLEQNKSSNRRAFAPVYGVNCLLRLIIFFVLCGVVLFLSLALWNMGTQNEDVIIDGNYTAAAHGTKKAYYQEKSVHDGTKKFESNKITTIPSTPDAKTSTSSTLAPTESTQKHTQEKSSRVDETKNSGSNKITTTASTLDADSLTSSTPGTTEFSQEDTQGNSSRVDETKDSESNKITTTASTPDAVSSTSSTLAPTESTQKHTQEKSSRVDETKNSGSNKITTTASTLDADSLTSSTAGTTEFSQEDTLGNSFRVNETKDSESNKITTTTSTPDAVSSTSSTLAPTASSQKHMQENSSRVDETKNSRINEETTAVPNARVDSDARVDEADSSSPVSRQRASRMLSYMNHLADPCEDFYEYACGEFEANRIISQKDLAREATQRIFAKTEKTKESKIYSEFAKFYESCLNYEDNFDKSDKQKLAIEAVDEVGSFDSLDEFNLTDILYKLFLRNSALLFDITPDIATCNDQTNCKDPSEEVRFILKIGPPIRESVLYDIKRERDCYKEQDSERLAANIDLYQLYEKHTTCERNIENFLSSVEEELKEFPAIESSVKLKRYDIDLLIKDYLNNFYSAEDKIREAYLTKNYTEMTVTELQKKIDPTFLNWTQLLESVTNTTVKPDQLLQIYFSDVLFKELENLSNNNEISLNNALLGLYAHKVYNEFVMPRRDVEGHCKSVAMNLMKMHASSLYMSSFSPEEHEKINKTVMDMFKELTDTLESNVKNASDLQGFDGTAIIRKIRGLSITLPDISYYQNGGELDPENSKNKLNFTGNFFRDAMMLLNHSRKSMYRLLEKSTNEYEQIWTYFAQPYQTSGSVIYQLDKIILPYGIVDWSTLWSDEKEKLSHLVMATLGTRIAKEIAHHFDPTGLHYLGNEKIDPTDTVLCYYHSANEICPNNEQKYQPVDGTLLLSSTNQTVEYKLTDLSLNERFSDITGLQLAYDAMLKRGSRDRNTLAWLNDDRTNEKKQFFLAHAQMFCTSVPLTSSYGSLYKDEHLPSRLKISVVGSSNKFLGETWECPEGTNIRPENIPSIFPYQDKTPVGGSLFPVETRNAHRTGSDDASSTTISRTKTMTETFVGESISPVSNGDTDRTVSNDATSTTINPTGTTTETPVRKSISPITNGDTDRTDGDDASSTTIEPSRSTTETPVGRSTSPVKTGNTDGTGSEDASSTSSSPTETTRETPVGESTSPMKTGNAYGTGNDDASQTTISPTETITETPGGETIPPVTSGDTDRTKSDDASSTTINLTETITETPVGESISPIGTENIYRTGSDAASSTTINFLT